MIRLTIDRTGILFVEQIQSPPNNNLLKSLDMAEVFSVDDILGDNGDETYM